MFKRVLFGGSFNPVHIGHLLIARDVLEKFGFEEVLFVPANLQPLKGKLFLPAEIRLKLLEVCTSYEKGMKVWDCEIRRGGVSYTVDTLEEFVRTYGEKPVFMVGTDSVSSLPKWKNPEKILEISKLLVLKRPGTDNKWREVLKALRRDLKICETEGNAKEIFKEWDVVVYNCRRIEISSTEIRKRLKQGKSIKFFLPEPAEKILKGWWENEGKFSAQVDAQGHSEGRT